jgi:thiosulfate/3-mercaptopyruvate sulfurtransferase
MTWNSSYLVTADWLAGHLADPDVAILDGSWHLPPDNRDAGAEFDQRHIPGAQFFDINAIADVASGLPHMLPADAQFADAIGRMGIGNGARVVVYDTKGLFSAARVWWTFRVMGHDSVAVLDGGLPKWLAQGRAVEAGPARNKPAQTFVVRRNNGLVRDRAGVRALLGSPAVQLVDARPVHRFTGEQPEPRPGLTQGHLPGARNLPFTQLLNADGTLKSEGDLRSALAAAGVDAAKPVVASCGSGVTASMVALALALLGRTETAVYDGSWAEWGRDAGNPVATGPA